MLELLLNTYQVTSVTYVSECLDIMLALFSFYTASATTQVSLSSQVTDELLPCPSETFQCQNGECVLDTARCDNIIHCSDGSDELGCGRQNHYADHIKYLNFRHI